MGLILEGADASGKSTLGRLIHKVSGRPLHLSGPAPKDDAQMASMILAQEEAARDRESIVDRISCISQQIYREGLFFRQDLMDNIKSYEGHSILVYCRPPDHVLMNPSMHEWKDYDTAEWKAEILSKQQDYIKRYDLLMSRVPCVIYDWTAENAEHVRNMLCEFCDPCIQERLQEMAQNWLIKGVSK
jgi:hypothetical protein